MITARPIVLLYKNGKVIGTAKDEDGKTLKFELAINGTELRNMYWGLAGEGVLTVTKEK